jgi:hypothetical protein
MWPFGRYGPPYLGEPVPDDLGDETRYFNKRHAKPSQSKKKPGSAMLQVD